MKIMMILSVTVGYLMMLSLFYIYYLHLKGKNTREGYYKIVLVLFVAFVAVFILWSIFRNINPPVWA